MMSNDLDFFLATETSSRLNNSKEEFGLKKEAYIYVHNNIKGLFKSIEFNTWRIQRHTLEEIKNLDTALVLNKKHKYFILNVSNSTALTWTVENQAQELSQKTGIFINNPLKSFRIGTTLTETKIIIFELKEAYFKQSIFNESLQHHITSTLNSQDRFTFNVDAKKEAILKEIFDQNSFGLCQLMSLNNKIFEFLASVIDFSSVQKKENKKHPYHLQLEKVTKQIKNNLEIQFSIETLSKTAGLNTSYLKKYFKEAYGITIFEYSQKKRIKYAKKLLKKSTHSIATIAEKVGYQQSAHFSYAFKRNTGFSPNQYRKNKLLQTTLP